MFCLITVYLKHCQHIRLYSINCSDVWLIMKKKRYERNICGLILGAALRGVRKAAENVSEGSLSQKWCLKAGHPKHVVEYCLLYCNIWCHNFKQILVNGPLPQSGLRYCTWYSNSPQAGQFGDAIPVGARFSSPIQTRPGAQPASYTVGTESFRGVKQLGHGVNHPPSSSTEVKESIEPYLCSMCFRGRL